MGFDMPIPLDFASSPNQSFLGLTKDSQLIQIVEAFSGKDNPLSRAIAKGVKDHEKKVRASLNRDEDWKTVSDNIAVSFSGGNLTYTVTGGSEAMEKVKELEYGSAERTASGFLRKLSMTSDKVAEDILSDAMKTVFG